jgi:acetylglutamate kinase
MTRLVVKVGGAVASSVARQVLDLAADGCEVCVVHGAGPQISAEMARLGLPVEFVRGRRVTSPEALEVVRASFASVNAALCRAIGPRALPLHGDRIGLVARPVPELGLVGDPLACRPAAVESGLAEGLIPVVIPLAAGPLNVNADEAASALAIGLGAERILFLTDVPGLMLEGSVVTAIAADAAEGLLDAGELEGGIVPKLRAAVAAAKLGVQAEIGETVILDESRITSEALGVGA